MSRTTNNIHHRFHVLAYSCAALVIALNVTLLVRSDHSQAMAAIGLSAIAVGLAFGQARLSRLTTVSVTEFPLLAALLLLDPGMAMGVGVLVGLIPPGRLGNLSRAVNVVFFGVPIVLASAAFSIAQSALGLAGPHDAPVLWFGVAVGAVAVDSVTHFALHGFWNRLAYGFPLKDWLSDVVVPCLKNDPMAALLVVPLVEIGLLLDGVARTLPIALAVVAIFGTWLSLQTTRKQLEARDLKDDFFRAIFVSLARLLEMKDPNTAIHSARVAIFSHDIAAAMGLSEEEQGRIHLAGLLHDVGKVGVPDEILLKPGRLSDDERATMERHARLSAEALQGIPGFGDLVRTVYAHHERIDGSGYPEGIEGEALPTGARILGVADTFEALTSDRPYRKGRSAIEALEVFDREIELFDPVVVDALRSVVLTGPTRQANSTRITDFSDEWARAARHLEVRLDEEHFVLPPEPPRYVKCPSEVDSTGSIPETPPEVPIAVANHPLSVG